MAWTDPATGPAVTGTVAPASLWNTFVRDNFLAMGPHLIAKKSIDEPLASNTTLQNDNDLIVPGLANEIWRIEWFLRYEADTAADLKTAWTFPTGAGAFLSLVATGRDSTSAFGGSAIDQNTSPSATMTWTGAGAGEPLPLRIEGWWSVGATPGDLVLQWAQVVSNATATKMLLGSSVFGLKL